MPNNDSPQNEYHPTLTSPEGLLMLLFAALVYITGLVCLALDVFFGIGEIPRLVVDIISTVGLGAWMMVRGGTPQVGSKLKQFAKKRLGWMVAEDIPFVGDLFPGDLIATLGFLTQQNQPAYAKAVSTTAKISRAVALLFLLLPPVKSFAAELSYPSFFAIDKTASLGDLIKIFYSAALGIGAVLATGYIIFLGLQMLASRGRPETSPKIRERIKQILLGAAILAGTIVILRTINPELPILRLGPITLPPAQPVTSPALAPTAPNELTFNAVQLGRTLDQTNVFLNGIDDDASLQNVNRQKTLDLLRDRATTVKTDLSQCSPSLCVYPGPIGYRTNDSHGFCTVQHTCTLDQCNGGDPCSPGRSNANTKLGDPAADTATEQTVVGAFRDLQDFWQKTIKRQRDLITECVVAQDRGQRSFVTLADALRLAQDPNDPSKNQVADLCAAASPSCRQSTDFFCENPATSAQVFTNLRLSLDDPITDNGLLQKEAAFIHMLEQYTGETSALPAGTSPGIFESINSCACSHATATCPNDACQKDTVDCTDNRDLGPGNPKTSSGCYETMWSDLTSLMTLEHRMENLYSALQGEMGAIDIMGNDEILDYAGRPINAKSFYANTCSNAKILTSSVCPQAKTTDPRICCPNQATKDDIIQCENEDFYQCIIPPSNP